MSIAATLNMHTDITVAKNAGTGSAMLCTSAGAVLISKGIVAKVEAKLGKALPSRPGPTPTKYYDMHSDNLTTVTSSSASLTIHGPADGDIALTVMITGVAYDQLAGSAAAQ